MNIRLTQLDGKLPNLALMKLSHFHKAAGDNVYFERSIRRGMFEPAYDKVYGSAIFSTSADKIKQFKQEFPGAIVGGTGSEDVAFKVEDIIGCGEYEYENYDYEIYPDFKHSIGFTQRGCKTGTQGRKGAHHRSMIPEELCLELMGCLGTIESKQLKQPELQLF